MQEKFFESAFHLAQTAEGFTSPNPCVGAVVVKRGKIIGTGYHKKAGGPHAEVFAIQEANEKGGVKGSEIYVTLEPCCHVGKTPACTDLIIKSGIKKVYVGMKDPFKRVNGGGIRVLKKAGIEVEVLSSKNYLAQSIRKLNQPFLKWAITGLPYVTLKVATTLDGKIATAKRDSKWITGENTRVDARFERGRCDAVLVGSGTVKADNPELAPHGKYKNKNLKRIIVDPDLSTFTNATVYRDTDAIVVTTSRASRERRKAFEKKNIFIHTFEGEQIDIKKLLTFLGAQGLQHIFVEGGSSIHGSFFDAAKKTNAVIDRVVWYIAPKLIGGKGSISAIGGKGVKRMRDGLSLKNLKFEMIEDDLKISGFFNLY